MLLRLVVFLIALPAVLVPGAEAQDASVRVTAQAEPMEVTVGNAVVLTVQVRGAPATVIRTPKRPAAVHLQPRQQRPDARRTRSMQGGALRRTVTYSWRFRAQRAGAARIQPVTIVVRGEEYTTAPLEIRVLPASDTAAGPTLREPEGGAGGSLDTRDLFVRATSTAGQAYQNEQVVVEYRLFFRSGIRLRHSRLADSWDAPGFWREELNVASRPTPRTQRAYGRQYETVVLKRVALFPTRPGTLRVDPLRIETEAQGTVQARGGGASLRGRFRPVQLASRTLSVRVRPLPDSAPESFRGAVGQFDMTTRVEADSAAVGRPLSLTVQVEGRGTLTTLSPPRLDSVPGLDVYEPTVETDVERNGRSLRGTKTFTYTLVPRTGGRHAVPRVAFSYFDPEKRQYQTLRARGPVLQVAGTAAPRFVGRTGTGLPVGDVAGLMTANEAQWGPANTAPLYRRPWIYWALLLPVGGAVAGLVFRRWRRQRPASVPSPSSASAAHDRLEAARHHRADGDAQAVCEALEQALRTAVMNRLGLDAWPQTPSRLDRHLRRHDVPGAFRTRLRTVLRRCNESRYAPADTAPAADPDALLEAAEALLRDLDRQGPAAPH